MGYIFLSSSPRLSGKGRVWRKKGGRRSRRRAHRRPAPDTSGVLNGFAPPRVIARLSRFSQAVRELKRHPTDRNVHTLVLQPAPDKYISPIDQLNQLSIGGVNRRLIGHRCVATLLGLSYSRRKHLCVSIVSSVFFRYFFYV